MTKDNCDDDDEDDRNSDDSDQPQWIERPLAVLSEAKRHDQVVRPNNAYEHQTLAIDKANHS